MNLSITDDITFRKLTIFMTFMEKGNIARTAEALNISGVSVHRALHTLEENVRCPLFVHKGRNLIAQPAAWTLLEYCQEVTQLMERGLEETRKTAGVGQGRLRVGTLYSLTLETVPHLIMGMKLRRPDLELDLTMGSNEALLKMLEDGVLDAILISISESEIDRNSLEVLPLFHDDIYLAAPMTATLDATLKADLRHYRNEKFVSLAEGFATYAGFQEAFHIAGFEPEIVTRVNDIMGEIASASDEQRRGIEQVAQAVTQMDQVTQQNASLVEEGAAATQQLADQADRLTNVVSVFSLEEIKAAAPRESVELAAVPAVS